MNRDYPLAPSPEPGDNDRIDEAKKKSGFFAKKDLMRKDFPEKESALSDSADKYSDIVFNAAKNMGKKELDKKGITRNVSAKGDTSYNYSSNGISFKKK